jgi:hypothetical protein
MAARSDAATGKGHPKLFVLPEHIRQDFEHFLILRAFEDFATVDGVYLELEAFSHERMFDKTAICTKYWQVVTMYQVLQHPTLSLSSSQ